MVLSTGPIFSIEECNKLLETGRNLPPVDAQIGTASDNPKTVIKDHKIRKTNIAWLPFDQLPWVYARLEHWMHAVNNKHMGFNQLQIGEMAQFTFYSKKHHYDWHSDSAYIMEKAPMVRKMSMIALLNDPKEFKGGELQLVNDKRSLPLKQGYGVFFASFIAHRVVPVKKGIRSSLTVWFGGPPLV
jgi:PKHD-type hydroxylase